MRTGREDGSATIWVLAVSGLVVAVAYAVVVLGAADQARQRAAAAADLAALAGATHLGAGDACLTAERVAAVNGARLTSCTDDGATVSVVASVAVPVGLRGWGGDAASARARAGPAAPAAAAAPGAPAPPVATARPTGDPFRDVPARSDA